MHVVGLERWPVQELRELAVLEEDPTSVPSTMFGGWLMTA